MHAYLESLKRHLRRNGLGWPWQGQDHMTTVSPPPFSVIRRALEELEQEDWRPGALKGRLHVKGHVDGINDQPCAVSIVVNDRLAQVMDTDDEGRFALQLPEDATIRFVLIQPGHLPRMIELRPWEGRLSKEHGGQLPIHLHAVLTPREAPGVKPLTERITLLDRHGKLLLEWDRIRGQRCEDRSDQLPLRRAV